MVSIISAQSRWRGRLDSWPSFWVVMVALVLAPVASAVLLGPECHIRPRAAHDARQPVHVTLRAAALPLSLRSGRVFRAVRDALARASRDAFRVVAFSVQRDHLHLIVEAESAKQLTAGLQGLAIRVAKAVNRVLERRGSGVGGSLSRACSVQSACRPQRSGLRPAELAEASAGRSRARPVLVGCMVLGMAPSDAYGRSAVAGRRGAHLARALGLAEARADRRARGTRGG